MSAKFICRFTVGVNLRQISSLKTSSLVSLLLLLTFVVLPCLTARTFPPVGGRRTTPHATTLAIPEIPCQRRNRCEFEGETPLPFHARNCFCDDMCTMYGDCCHNYDPTTAKGGINAPHIPMTRRHPSVSCQRIEMIDTAYEFYIVNSCPKNYRDKYVKQRCDDDLSLDVLLKLPVTGRTNGILYRNIYCAMCAGDSDVTFWNIVYKCSGFSIAHGAIDTLDKFKARLKTASSTCPVEFLPPPNGEPRKCKSHEDKCHGKYSDEKVIKKCKGPTSYVYLGLQAYRNKFCVQCNNIAEKETQCQDERTPRIDPMAAEREIPPISPSLVTLSVDFNTATGVIMHGNQTRALGKAIKLGHCDEDEVEESREVVKVYDAFTGKCHVISCGDNMQFSEGSCLSTTSHSNHRISSTTKLSTKVTIPVVISTTTTTPIPTTPATTTTVLPTMKTKSARQRTSTAKVSTVSNLIGMDMETTKSDIVMSSLPEEIAVVKAITMLTTTSENLTRASSVALNIATTISRNDFTRRKDIDALLPEMFDVGEASLSQSDNATFTDVMTTAGQSAIFTSTVVASTAFGHDMLYDKEHKKEVEMNLIQQENPTLSVNNNSPTLRNDGNPLLMIIFRYESLPAIVTFALCIAAMTILFGAFIALAMTPMPCGSFPRLLQCLILMLFLALLLYILAVANSSDILNLNTFPRKYVGCFCFWIAALLHYTIISGFLWLNVLAIDLCRSSMQRSGLEDESWGRRWRFVAYCGYAWLTPACGIGLCVFFDIYALDYIVRPQYAYGVCWLGGSSTSILILFALPLATLTLANFILYAVSACYLCGAVAGTTRHLNRSLIFSIFLCLCVFLAWTSAFLASFYPSSIVVIGRYVFLALNASEGFVAGIMGLWLCATMGSNYRILCNGGGADAGRRHEDGGFLWKANTAQKKKPRPDDEPNERVEILSLETCI